MKKIIAGFCLFVIAQSAYAQNVAINTDGSQPNGSAMLDVKHPNKGLLIPRVSLVSETDAVTVSSPVLSLLVFNTNAALPEGAGFYYWNGNNKWSKLVTISSLNNASWGLSGNSAINPINDFIGTIDNQPLIFKTNNILSGKIAQAIKSVFFGQHAGETITTGENNSFFGHEAGAFNTTGEANTAVGSQALFNNIDGEKNVAIGFSSLLSNTSGSRNVAIGNSALKDNTTGSDNVTNGFHALFSNTTGSKNFAAGSASLYSLTSGFNNIAIGDSALFSANTSSENIAIGRAALHSSVAGALYNVAVGTGALYSNITGDYNTAVGHNALNKSTGSLNTAFGAFALVDNTVGIENNAFGHGALINNIVGNENDAFGRNALHNNTSGDYNAAFGNSALYTNYTGNGNTAVGNDALRDLAQGDFNTSVGYLSGTAGADRYYLDNTTALGYQAAVTTENTMVFGNGSVRGWAFGLSTAGASRAIQVGTNNTNGNGAYLSQTGTWTNTSSRTKKENFTDLDNSELLNKISNLSIQKWKYKGSNEYHIGPVAEDFFAAFGLGVDDQGISSVDPAGIALAAIKQLIKEHETLKRSLDEQIAQLQKRIEALEKK